MLLLFSFRFRFLSSSSSTFFLSFFSFVSSVCYYLLFFLPDLLKHMYQCIVYIHFSLYGTLVCVGGGEGGMVPVVTRSWDLCETRNDVTHPWGVCGARDDTSRHASLGCVILPR